MIIFDSLVRAAGAVVFDSDQVNISWSNPNGHNVATLADERFVAVWAHNYGLGQ